MRGNADDGIAMDDLGLDDGMAITDDLHSNVGWLRVPRWDDDDDDDDELLE